MKTRLLLCSFLTTFSWTVFANGGPASMEAPEPSEAQREKKSPSRSTREAAQENQRNGSFPGSFGTIDRQEEELVPEEALDFEGIEEDPYQQIED